MNNKHTDKGAPDPDPHTSDQTGLPGFLDNDELGLGDMIGRATNYFGIKPCAGCERRAAALDRRFVFKRRRHR